MLGRPHVEPKHDATTTLAPSTSSPRASMKDHEGLILAQPEFYFVVDCPSLHIVSGDSIGSRRQTGADTGLSTFDHAFCPRCQQVITKTRQITFAPSIPSPGLDSLASKHGSAEVTWPPRPYSTDLPEVVPGQMNPPLAGRISSSTGTLHKPKRMGIFSRLISSPQPLQSPRLAKSVASADSQSGSKLPSYLSFCFSLSGENLLIWKKDGQALVRIEVESRGSRLLDLTDILPAPDEVTAITIRYVAEGNDWICMLLSHNRRLVLLVLHSSGLREESNLYFIDEGLDPKALAISPDNSFIAIGFGTRIYLFNYEGCHQQWRAIFAVPGFGAQSEVKFQVLNFSPDNSTLAVATQRHDIFRSAEDDTISTYIWKCSRQPQSPQRMGACKMPTDSRGLTSIQHSAALSTSLVLGGSPIPYPLFLAPESSPPPPIPSTMTEFRIRCACLSSPPNAHIAYMMDVKNKVFKVDMRARSILQIADLNMERGALSVRDEAAAIGTSADGTIRLFWRQGGGLWIRAIGERFATGSGQKMNLRGVWEDAGGG